LGISDEKAQVLTDSTPKKELDDSQK